MSQVVTLLINGDAEKEYHHASVNYNWDADKRSLNLSVLTLPKRDSTDEPPYLEVRLTFNKIIPGSGIEKAKVVVRADQRGHTFSSVLNEKDLFGGPVIAGSHIDILDTHIYSFDSKNSTEPLLYFGKHDSKKELALGAHCILEGTTILTPDGWIPIEKLSPGDKVLSHNGSTKTIIKRAVWGLKYEKSPVCNDGRVFKIECGYAGNKEQVFVSYHHKVYTYYKQFVKAGHARLPEATQDEIAPSGYYRLYNIQVDNHTKNHLVVGGGLIIESWDGKTDSKVKTKVVAKH